MMGGAGASSALSVPLEGWLGSWQAALGRGRCSPSSGVLAWVPVLTGHARHRAANPSVVAPARLPWRHARPGSWPATSPSSRSSSTPRWRGSRPSYTARGWDPTHAGYLLSVFTAAQLVSGLLAPALTDRIHDRRVLLLSASVLGLLGQAGLWLAPTGCALGLGDGPGVRPGGVVRARAGADGRLRRHPRRQRAAGRDGVLLQLHDRVVRTGEHGRACGTCTGGFTAVWGDADDPDARPGRLSSLAAPGPAQGRVTPSAAGSVEGDVRARGRGAERLDEGGQPTGLGPPEAGSRPSGSPSRPACRCRTARGSPTGRPRRTARRAISCHDTVRVVNRLRTVRTSRVGTARIEANRHSSSAIATPTAAKKTLSPVRQVPPSAGPGSRTAMTPKSTRVQRREAVGHLRPRRATERRQRPPARPRSAPSAGSDPTGSRPSQPAGGDVGHQDRPRARGRRARP